MPIKTIRPIYCGILLLHPEGSTSEWTGEGGTIIDGQGTYSVTIEWGESGERTVTVVESLAECSSSSEDFEVVIEECTNQNEKNVNNKLTIYPGPVRSLLHLTVELDDSYSIYIVNYMGTEFLNTYFKNNVAEN